MSIVRRRRHRTYLISLAEAALTLAARYARENLPREVGGVLVGWREGESTIVVQDLLLVPHATPTQNRYDREHEPADVLLQEYLNQAGDPRLGYVGEWHTHPEPVPASTMDLGTIRRIGAQLKAPVALVVLMAHRDGDSIEPAGHIARRATSGTRLHDAHISTH